MKRLIVIVARAVAPGAVSAAILAGSALTVQAQTPTLGEVAKKEADRRKAQPAAGKVYTNKDLPPSAQTPAAAPPSGPETAAPVEAVGAATREKPAEPKPEGAPKDESCPRGQEPISRHEYGISGPCRPARSKSPSGRW